MARRIGIALSIALVLSPLPAQAQEPDSRQAEFSAAAAEFGVPESILLGVSYLESRWDYNAGTPSTGGGFGPMHLTDAAYVGSLPVPQEEHEPVGEDRRGDDSRAELPGGHGASEPAPSLEALQTMDKAAELTGASKEELRTETGENIRGGAAILSSYQAQLGAPTGLNSDPAAWYGAVAKYSGADTEDGAAAFADEVFATIRDGVARRTDDGSQVSLAPQAITPDKSWLGLWRLRKLERPDGLECPLDIACEWFPAAYALRGNGTDKTFYGQYDKANRPQEQRIEYIVIHDAEGYYASTVRAGQNKDWGASWHYTMRSVDGQTAQHIKAKDVGWHAGNWYVNGKAIGIEHEGFAAQGTWYTETMYRTSAKLVRHIAFALGIPLDRQHIVGHDNIPGITPSRVPAMHWDPGPYWDWGHYFDLLKRPFWGTGTSRTGMVTINPDFASNKPAFTNCPPLSNPSGPALPGPCPVRGSTSVMLRQAPSHDAPLVNDKGLRPDGTPNTMRVSDMGARVDAGQQFAIAEVSGDWTAIWYLGNKAWFHNPSSARNALWSFGFVAKPKAGKTSIPVYGRAYPEEAAYPAGVPYQTITPLQYSLPAGQKYVVGNLMKGEYYRAVTYDWSSPGDGTVIQGDMTYVQIQFGHRFMFVNLADVDIVPSVF
ncbi:N-acetylmuramoyl-L-alanine amidase [Catelliglobosispora koreensis]|uniref:N-acetylmuramoyl-L-alanine amidase n=1 Tax=Catelliglobosispora koreensis TaxID=129052 RepID=UPI000361FC03|nr:peptidoglycan recognition family protein [Catelliglobosispora koreensis]